MQYNYTYNPKHENNNSSYRALFLFFAKLLLIIFITFLVMLINISKTSAQTKLLIGANEVVEPGGYPEKGTDFGN